MFKKTIIVIAIISSIFYMASGYSDVITELYSAQVPVVSRSGAEKATAIPKALQQVLVKVSGNSQIMQRSSFSKMIKNANSYVHEYSYVTLPNKDQATQSSNALLLKVDFDSNAINQALTQANLPIWPKTRPLTLAWLVVQDNSGQHFVNSDSKNVVLSLLQQYAKQRGLPLLLPMLDLKDMFRVKTEDIVNFSSEKVINASERYSPDEVLLVYLDIRQPNSITGRWLLLLQGQKMQWETDSSSIDSAIQVGANDVADALANHYAVLQNSAQQNSLTVNVSSLSGFSDYAKVMQYLRGLTGVANVQVLNVSSTEASFTVTLNSNVGSLQQALRLGGVLKPDIQNAQQSGSSNQNQILSYRYERKSK